MKLILAEERLNEIAMAINCYAIRFRKQIRDLVLLCVYLFKSLP